MLHIESAGWNRRGRRRPQAVSRPHRDSPTDSSPSDSPPPDSPPPPPPSQLREPSPERWGIGYPPVQGTERDSADSIAGLPVNVHSGASSSLTSRHNNLPGRGNQRSVGLSDRVLTTEETGGSGKRMSGTVDRSLGPKATHNQEARAFEQIHFEPTC
ncbi:hypothetical protein K435DRAFT_773673 [Dendrothele bispora CBS 962.96]|uniref:Uncharacterized protein n=1 Tax=Dendrothele bispora (strain CBS 962.96) TaxID=1314807 RepID=A0A4V4HIA0_DENBC|nr:hypothetical protein K435DRAFT_773673 [Dendrothele bispora CBS 962.96]